MFEIIRNILTHPFWTISVIIVLWLLLFFLFTFFKLNDTNWKRLEFIWIIAGLLGLLTIIDQNNKDFKSNEINYIKKDIEFGISHLKFYLSEPQACFKYIKSEWSPDDLALRQLDQDKICSWARNFIISIDSLEGIPTAILDTNGITYIKFNTDFMDTYVKECKKTIYEINLNISKFNEYSSEIKSNDWEVFSKSIGPLLLILAFAVRLSIATNNVRVTKNQIKNSE